jgi:hypothetical protein
MSRLALFALFANATAVVLHENGPAPTLTSFETGCYEKDPNPTEDGGAKGRNYRGLVSNSESGGVCKNWVSSNKFTGLKMEATPDIERADGTMKWGNGLGNHNYCRNPDPNDARTKPWCYTVDPKGAVNKEACNIDACGKKKNYVAMAKALTKTMMSTESTGNCMCEDKVRKALNKFTVENFGSGGQARIFGSRFDFLQKSRMGLTKDGKPCFCKN